MNKQENPMAKKSINASLSRMLKKKNGKSIDQDSGTVNSYLIGMNNGIPICAEASACCWDVKLPDTYEGMAAYVSRRTKTGHTSVIEHSNMVMFLEIPKSFTDDLIFFLDNSTYLESEVYKSDDNEEYYLIIGGALRAFSDLYREFVVFDNRILNAVTNILYTYADSAYFEDLFADGILDKDRFLSVEPDPSYIIGYMDMVDTDLFKIINMDSIEILYRNLFFINKDAAKKVRIHDLIKFTTITVLFKNMTRATTHQLVRHRNAITQESQRYVDYSEACFSSPAMFKPDKYNPDYKYPIRFGSSGIMHMNLEEIGNAICNIYEILRNPANSDNNNALMKEDARAYLPTNVQCRKIYITFTFKKFLKFLNLREDKHAQAEIRMYATSVGDWFRANNDIFTTKEICDKYTKPNSLNIDESLDYKFEEFVSGDELTVDDYVRALGLNESTD